MYTVGVLTVSDRCHSGLREDVSGQVILDSLSPEFFEVRCRAVCPDDAGMIADELLSMCDSGCELILTTGGIGFAPRDVTPEATVSVLDKNAPGLAELLRLKSADNGISQRGVAGIHEETLIVNLPGTASGVREGMGLLQTILPRLLETLRGEKSVRYQ